jgi:large subunit ribosomal protein L17
MRHAKYGGKLGRTSAHRNAMLRNLVTSLLDQGRVQTTDAKAKELRRLADRMITLGKRGDLHARRQALSVIRKREVTAKVFDELAERFRARPGGYTRVLKTGYRTGDAAPLSIVELVEGTEAPAARGGARAAKPAKAAKPPAEKPAKKKAARKPAAEKAAKPEKPKKAGDKKAPRAKKKPE